MTIASYVVLFIIGFIILSALTVGTLFVIKKAPEGSNVHYRALGFLITLVMLWVIAIGLVIWFTHSLH